MSILIKGMEMPCCCDECRFLNEYGDYPCCIITDEQRGYNFKTREKRMDNCPLVPVPPHGRLGDLDALHKLFLEKAKEYKGVGGAMVAMAALCIANAPTIIPASEEAQT